VTAGAAALRLPGLSRPVGFVFDEIWYARERLGSISDSWRALIWFAQPIGLRTKTLSCRQEMARLGGGSRPSLLTRGPVD